MMEPVPPSWLSIAWLPVTVFAFLLPGWLLSRLWQSPAPWLTAFLASSCLFFNGTLALDALGLPLHAGTIGGFLTLTSAVFVWILYRRRPVVTPDAPSSAVKWDWESALWLVPVALAIVSIGAHAIISPLSGYDNVFRWDYLARLTLMKGSLDGYPPVSAKDFEYYAWCDGIPPLVSLLNFWIYTTTGSIAPALVTARVVSEALLIGLAIHRYSRLLWGSSEAGPALAVASSSALLLWGVMIGQETGLTTLSLVGMLYFLEIYAREGRISSLAWAAMAASLAAISREYGLAVPILGFAILAARKKQKITLLRFATVTGLLAGPWYARNWILTGNPLFPHTAGGIFPGNAVHEKTMLITREQWGWFSNVRPFSEEMSLFFIATAGASLLFGIAGALHPKGRNSLVVAGIPLVILLWLWSIPYTAGGWTYSTRVLLPVVALLAILSGVIATWSRSVRMVCLSMIFLATVDASRRAWFLPMFAGTPPTKLSTEAWRSIHASFQQIAEHPVWGALVSEAGSLAVLVDHPANHSQITLRGGHAVPLFSPAVAPLFQPAVGLEEGLDHLKRERIGLIAISSNSQLRVTAFESHLFWREFFARFKETARVEQLLIFDLRDLQVRQP